nr:MAG TPA: hypothetical protein [Caudoviricetes sp.]
MTNKHRAVIIDIEKGRSRLTVIPKDLSQKMTAIIWT